MGWLTDAINGQPWVGGMSEVVQGAVQRSWAAGGERGRSAQDVLHGRWLGHPLHPMLTDVTIGFWMTASYLDALEASGRPSMAGAADAVTAAGLASSLATAAAGATDWQYASGRARRTGFVHASLNNLAAACYGLSLVRRRRGDRGQGRLLALVGLAALSVSGYLGGGLTYEDRMGMSYLPTGEPPEEFTPVLDDAALTERAPCRVEAAGYPVLLVRLDGRVHAMASVCAHMGGPLEDGRVEGGCIVCPWHGSRYRLSDGSVRTGPSVYSQPALETRVQDGRIEVRAGQARAERS